MQKNGKESLSSPDTAVHSIFESEIYWPPCIYCCSPNAAVALNPEEASQLATCAFIALIHCAFCAADGVGRGLTGLPAAAAGGWVRPLAAVCMQVWNASHAVLPEGQFISCCP